MALFQRHALVMCPTTVETSAMSKVSPMDGTPWSRFPWLEKDQLDRAQLFGFHVHLYPCQKVQDLGVHFILSGRTVV